MIPKIIHLCWFGEGKFPPLVEYCVNSWKEKLPDFQIMVWNEETFDVNSTIWTKQAYEVQKWAFVSDYARLFALKKYGGVYLDTDVEVIRDFSALLKEDKYICSFIEQSLVSMGVVACPKNCKYINSFLDYYVNRPFIKKDGTFDEVMNTLIFTKILMEKYGIPFGVKDYITEDLVIYTMDYFMPYKKNFFLKKTDKKSYILTDNTYTIHHDMGSWDKENLLSKKIKSIIRLITPCDFYLKLKKKKFKKQLDRIEYQ